MIRLRSHELTTETLSELAELQAEIDGYSSYQEQCRAATAVWSTRRQRKVFDVVENALSGLCSGPRRCMFCEDNGAYQIEHFRPKSIYPRLLYAWSNYLFACGQCNAPKSNRFAVFTSGGLVLEIQRSENEPASEPSVLLDPRQDDPMDYLWLDLSDTFLFKPIHESGTTDYSRAECTIRWLGLNSRDELVQARHDAYDDYLMRLEKYVGVRQNGGNADALKHRRRAIERSTHITVWREMQRQSQAIEKLRALFGEAPESLLWR